MAESGHLRLGDVRAALRLVGECRDLGHDPGLWGRHMFAGLCRLTGARVGGGGEARQPRSAGPPEAVHHVDAGYGPWEHYGLAAVLWTYGIERISDTVTGERRTSAAYLARL